MTGKNLSRRRFEIDFSQKIGFTISRNGKVFMYFLVKIKILSVCHLMNFIHRVEKVNPLNTE